MGSGTQMQCIVVHQPMLARITSGLSLLRRDGRCTRFRKQLYAHE